MNTKKELSNKIMIELAIALYFVLALALFLATKSQMTFSPIFYFIGVLFLFVLLFGYMFWEYKRFQLRKYSPVIHATMALKQYNFLIKQLVDRDFKSKYKRSVLGVFWSFLNPLLNMMVQYIVFCNLFRFDIPYFPVYLLCGNIMFSYFSEANGFALNSIVANASLITKVYVPKYIYPLTRILSSLINLVISLIPIFVVALISGLKPTLALLLIPYPLICLALFCLGLGMALGAGMVFFRDIQFLWGVVTTIWMYMTPIFYPVSILPDFLMSIMRLNPLYYYITFLRTCIIDGVSPSLSMYAACALFALIALCVGSLIFKKTQDKFVLYL